MMQPTPNPYSALLNYYKIALPGYPVPLQLQLQSSCAKMSSALSYATAAADQEMNDLALAVGHSHSHNRSHSHNHNHNHSHSHPHSQSISSSMDAPSPSLSPPPAIALPTAACAGTPNTTASAPYTNMACSDAPEQVQGDDTSNPALPSDSPNAHEAKNAPQPAPADTHSDNQTSTNTLADDNASINSAPAINDSGSLQSSLLLKPFPGPGADSAAAAEIVAPNDPNSATSMAAPQNLQGSNSISPLDMLIAALDPKNPQTASSSEIPPANPSAFCQPLSCTQMPQQVHNAGDGSPGIGSRDSLPASLWNPISVPSQEYYPCSMPWSTAAAAQPSTMRRASDGAFLAGYQFGRQQASSNDPSPLQEFASARDTRKVSYPPGIKRPYSEFNQLLSVADMYTAAGPCSGSSAFNSVADPSAPSKHVRYSSMSTASTAYTDPAAEPQPQPPQTFVGPNGESIIETTAAASMAYSTAAFPYSTNRSTALDTPARDSTQAQCLNTCFDSLNTSNGISLDAGIPMMSCPPPLAQPLISQQQQQQQQQSAYQKPAARQMVPPMPTSLHLASPTGYFYDGPVPSLPVGAASAGFMLAPNPIPAIPGVTVSPKEKPRRVSVPDLTPTAEEEHIGPKARPRRQKLRFADDLYTPIWVRNNGQQKEGFCDTCSPGKWLQLKNSAYWYHKQFFHGISSVSGCPFVRPLQIRHFDADIIEGLCHQCQQWVPIANAKRRNSVLWFRHAHKCHVYHKPKPDNELDCSSSL